MDPRIKQLRIKTGVLKRCAKEKEMYEKELLQELARYETMKEANKDEHDLRQQEKVIQETQSMLPDCQQRIFNGYNDLKALLQEVGGDLLESEEYILAKVVLDGVVV